LADISTQLAKSKDSIVRELAQARQICDRQDMELQQQQTKISALNAQLEAEVRKKKFCKKRKKQKMKIKY
jgi:hypothetical protein